MRSILAMLTVLGGLTALVGAAPAPKEEKSVADRLVGTWKLTASGTNNPADASFLVTFGAKGEMTVKITPKEEGADPITLKGTYKVIDGEKIDYTMDNGDGTKKQEVLKIKKLTEDELVTVDPDDIKEEFKRVKKDDKGEKKPKKI